MKSSESNSLPLFIGSLTPDIIPVERFVDWTAVNERVNALRREIALIESLDKARPLDDLTDILLTNSGVLDVLKLLIAHTPTKIYFADGRFVDFKEDKRRLAFGNKKRAIEVARLFEDTGLFTFLSEVRSVRDVVKGVLIGLQPNKRKSWRGLIFEERIKAMLDRVLATVKKRSGITLTYESQVSVDLARGKKVLDYLVFRQDTPIAAVEVNFYSTSGSKPSEVLERAYPDLERNLGSKKIPLIVISDGIGWLKMQTSIQRALNTLTHLMTIRQAEKGMLEKVLLKYLQ